ncbi:MAG: HlyD family efflux transporter periplasmic adaptor subunit [Proteobacteria bacterium]|nr:HlyD family efflux transporter periplasmic adaptor subunit [Pseudomonadota bacterium]
MKIKFRDQESSQPPVSQIQTDTKNKTVQHKPVFKLFLLITGVIILIWGGCRLYQARHIYAFGLVSGEVMEINARKDGIVTEVHLSAGDHFLSGDSVLSFVPFDHDLIVEAEENLKIKEDTLPLLEVLEAALNPDEISVNKGADKEMTGNDYFIHKAIDQLEQKRQLSYKQKQIEVDRQKKLYELKKGRYDRIKLLATLNAATRENMISAETEMMLGKMALDQALNDLDMSESELFSDSEFASIQMMLLDSSEYETSYAINKKRLLADINIAVAKLESLRKTTSPVTFVAPFDGVVTWIDVSPKQTVSKNKIMAVLVSKNIQWVDAYLENDKAHAVRIGMPATIYTEGRHDWITEAHVEKIGANTKIPDPLVKEFPGAGYGIYFRLKISPEKALLPGSQVRVVL